MKLIAKLFALVFQHATAPTDPEMAKAEAQIKIEEARAFRKGKLSPKYLLKYSAIILAVLFFTLLIIGIFFPNVVDISHLFETIEQVLNIVGSTS